MIGAVWTITPAMNLDGNVAWSFDPPTTTELANLRGAAGFNSDLKPQKATNGVIKANFALSLCCKHRTFNRRLKFLIQISPRTVRK